MFPLNNLSIPSNSDKLPCKSVQSVPGKRIYSIPNPYYKEPIKIKLSLRKKVSTQESGKPALYFSRRSPTWSFSQSSSSALSSSISPPSSPSYTSLSPISSSSPTSNKHSHWSNVKHSKPTKKKKLYKTSIVSTSKKFISPLDRSPFRPSKSSKEPHYHVMKNPFACKKIKSSADELTIMFARTMDGLPAIDEYDIIPKEKLINSEKFDQVPNSVFQNTDYNLSDDDSLIIDFNEVEFDQMLFKLSDNDESDFMSSGDTNYMKC